MPLTPNAALSKDRRNGNTIPTFQHRHFAWIAAVLSEYAEMRPFPRCQTAKAELAGDFADKLAETNPNFDRDRFMRACGV